MQTNTSQRRGDGIATGFPGKARDFPLNRLKRDYIAERLMDRRDDGPYHGHHSNQTGTPHLPTTTCSPAAQRFW